MRTSRRTIVVLASAAALGAALVAAPGGPSGAATSDALKGDGIGTAKFTTEGGGNMSPTAVTIPWFGSSFTDPTNGKTYQYSMVGTDPRKGDATTVIPTVIIPMRFTFDASADPAFHVLDGTDRVAATVNSPVFMNSDVGAAANATASASPGADSSVPAGIAPDPRTVDEPSDVTQLGDAIYRAQWGKSSSGYHVKLGTPTVMPTLDIAVPKHQGFITVGSRSGAHIGLMSVSWFSAKLGNALASLKISPKVLPIFLVNDTFLYVKTPGDCCILGYHGAKSSLNGNGKQQVNTYMFASYSTQGIFAANPGDSESFVADIHGLSHEVQEWYDDPFVNNYVNPWQTPTAPQYGCTSELETGDPVVGYGFKITMNGITYHPEDEVHYSWFARQSPSIAERGYFTYLNNFANIAHGC